MTYFKAVQPDGTSFHDPFFRWLPDGHRPGDPIPSDWVVRHPNPGKRIGRKSGAGAAKYLSISTVATDCTGFEWPCRLLEVEPVGRAYLDDGHRNKRRVRAARVIRELPVHEVFGPQGLEVVAILDRADRLTVDEMRALGKAWYAARDAARDAAWDAAGNAAWDAVWDAARVAARDAAWDAARDAVWDAARDAARDAAGNAAWYAVRPGNAARDAAWDAARDAAWDAAGNAVWTAARGAIVRDLVPEAADVLMAPWREVIGDV